MSNSSHLTKETYDLIKSIGEARSKQEETQIIKKDVVKMQLKCRSAQNIQSAKVIKETLIRCIYADMLGHNVEFAHLFAVNSCHHKLQSVKRVAYLSCCLLLSEDSSFRMMIVATLQKDLLGSSTFSILIALNTLCKMISIDNLDSFQEIVVRHLGHANALVAKKAYCVYQRILMIAPNQVKNSYLKMKDALSSRDHSVMSCSLNIYYQEISKGPDTYKDLTGTFLKIFNDILDVKLPRQYDYSRLPAPWMQIRLLQIIGKLCKNDKALSATVYDVVRKALRRADDTLTGIGFAVMFQCILTITQIYPNPSLLDKASSTISKFFSYDQTMNDKINKSNLRYLGIELIRALVEINPKYAVDHQMQIVECLEHPDESVKRQTLDLLFKTTNSQNLEFVINKMIGYLKSTSDPSFRKDLVNKIYDLNEALTPNPEYFVEVTNKLFVSGNDCISDTMLSRTISLIRENLDNDYDSEFSLMLINSYFSFLEKKLPDQMIKLIAWILGEVGVRLYSNDANSLKQLSSALQSLHQQNFEDEQTKAVILSSLSKLMGCEDYEADESDQEILEISKTSSNFEIRQRGAEYIKKPQRILALNLVEDYDMELSFLRNTIEKSIKMGNGKYDRSKKADKLLKKMRQKEISSKPILRTTHHQVNIQEQKALSNQDSKKIEKVNTKTWIKKKEGSETQGSFKKTSKPLPTFNKQKTQVNQEEVKKRQALAKGLFSGVEVQKKKKASTKKAPVFTKPNKASKGGNPFSKPAKSNKSGINSSKNETPVQEVDLLGGQSPSQPQNDLLTGDLIQDSTTFNKLEPSAIEIQDFESMWGQMEEELEKTIPTKLVTTKQAFTQLTTSLGFHIVKAIDTNNLCCAKRGQESVLFYGKYQLVGGLVARVRSNSEETTQWVVSQLEEYCKG